MILTYISIDTFKTSLIKIEHEGKKVCELIDHVRKIGMMISEEVTAMFLHFKYQPEKDDKRIGQHYLDIFRGFDEDLGFLKESTLVDYIPFSDDFDPLMIEPSRKIQKMYESKKVEYDENVEELFSFNISYMYRLLRAHQKIVFFAKIAMTNKEKKEIEENPDKKSTIIHQMDEG